MRPAADFLFLLPKNTSETEKEKVKVRGQIIAMKIDRWQNQLDETLRQPTLIAPFPPLLDRPIATVAPMAL